MNNQTSFLLLLISILTCASNGSSFGQSIRDVDSIAGGQALFTKEWKPGESLYAGADGIGPLFNERSCIACHSQAGIGGGSGIDKNVDILSLNSRATNQQKADLSRFHPGFRNPSGGFLNNIVLHRFGFDHHVFKTVYSKERADLMGYHVSLDSSKMDLSKIQRSLQATPIREVTAPTGITLAHSQRNSTALFGAGKIDKISDLTIAAEAIRQAKRGKVSGRVSQIPLPTPQITFAVGKFGWRAQQTTLDDFVEGACAIELGLNTKAQKQTGDPRHRGGVNQALDLRPADVRALSQFVGSLPKPREFAPNAHVSQLAVVGRAAFKEVGCAECHLRKLGETKGIYSDLLLHDMGPSLADPAPARDAFETNPKDFYALLVAQKTGDDEQAFNITRRMEAIISVPPVGYYGFESRTANPNPVIPLEVRQREWRTPPLWGVADSAPYMHDGRAQTLIEAIAYHNGEAEFSKKRFLRLPGHERKALLTFLGTLRAPEPN